MSDYVMVPNPSREQVAREVARARCRHDGGDRYRVTATSPAGKSIEQIEPSAYDRDRLIFDLRQNGYTNVESNQVGS